MTYQRYRERGFTRFHALVGAAWWRGVPGLTRLHVRHLHHEEPRSYTKEEES